MFQEQVALRASSASRRIVDRAWMTVFVGSLLGCGLLGCTQKVFRAETELHPDGRVDRAIFQPNEETPAEASRAIHWQGTTYSAERPAEAWDIPIRTLPPEMPAKETPYFAAWGPFPSVDRIPAHIVYQPVPDLPPSTLVRDFRTLDRVLLTEYQWTETLTDIVTLSDMRQAREELASIGLDLFRKFLDEALGSEYDTTALVRWVETEGQRIAFSLCDTIYDLGTQQQLFVDNTAELALARLAQKEGLNFFDPQGQLIPQDERNKVLEDWLRKLLRQHVKRKDGKPLEESTLDTVFRWWQLTTPPDPPPAVPPRGITVEKLTAAVQKVSTAHQLANNNANFTRENRLLHRIFGVYQLGLFQVPRQFHYDLRVPGVIVETNGQLLRDEHVEWSFDARQAYPHGYRMTCTAIRLKTDVVKNLFPRAQLETRVALLRLWQLLQREDYRRTLADCVEKSSPQPLQTLREMHNSQPDRTPRLRTQRLCQLLGLP